MGLSEGELAYTLGTGSERLYKASCGLEIESSIYTLNIIASEKSDGLIMNVFGVLPNQCWVYDFKRNLNIILNEQVDEELNIYVSKDCKVNKGQFTIVEWDRKAQTITGNFSGILCTTGMFAHLPGTEIKEGAFYKIKYNVE